MSKRTVYIQGVPAYGRDYKTSKAVREAWHKGHDFRCVTIGQEGYFNKESFHNEEQYITVELYFKNETALVLVRPRTAIQKGDKAPLADIKKEGSNL